MKKLVLLHDVSPYDDIDDLVDTTMKAIHGDGPWPEDDGGDLDEEAANHIPGGQSHDEGTVGVWSNSSIGGQGLA